MFNAMNDIEKINIYFLPLAAFFVLISTAVTNFFTILTVLTAFIICIKNNNFSSIYKENFFKACLFIYFLLVVSYTYSIADPNEVTDALKKYIKIVYIPFIYYYLKKYKNEQMVINFFIYGSSLVLVLSYIKYFDLIKFEYFYEYIEFLSMSGFSESIINTKAIIFQNYIIHGVILSFYSFTCLYLASKNKNYVFYALSALAFVNVVFLNDSRTAYIIITLLSLLSFYKVITNNRIRLIFLLIISILLSSSFSENLKNRINIVSINKANVEIENYHSSLGLRYIWSKVGMDVFTTDPILGRGVGSFYNSTIIYFKKYNKNISEKFISNNPHSEFISISAQLGILGLLSFIIFLYYLITSSTSLMSIAVSLVFVVSALFNSVFYDNMLGLFSIIIISLFFKNKVKLQN
jgi:O-antigen ligase